MDYRADDLELFLSLDNLSECCFDMKVRHFSDMLFELIIGKQTEHR